MPISARSTAALAAQRQRLIACLEAAPGHELRDIAFTLQAGRRHFANRLALVADSLSSLLASLRGEATPRPPPALTAMAQAFEAGEEARFIPPPQARRVSLPGYPFERQRHWIDQAEQRRTLSRHRHPRLLAAKPAEDLLPLLRGVLARCLDLPVEEIPASLGFGEMGVDSVVAPLLADELAMATGRR